MKSIYIRAQQGDLNLLSEFDTLTADAKNRCVALAAQFGQAQLLVQLIDHGIERFAEHALWVAAHDGQLESVEALTPLVSPDRQVWESVLRYAIKNNYVSLQHTILGFTPAVNVNSSLATSAKLGNRELMETLLKRATLLTSAVAVDMLLNQWNDLLHQWFDLLASEEKNKFFVYCVRHKDQEQHAVFDACKEHLWHSTPNALATAIEIKDWGLAEQLLGYCNVDAAVTIINKQRVDEETRAQLQRLVLLHEVGDMGGTTVKRKI